MKSEIFDEYVKISIAKSEEEDIKKRKNPRDNAMSAEEFAELYGLKPETYEKMDYDYNMSEIAHPDSLIVSPSYDPANGLVGNVNENHSRNLHVVNKEPRGILDGHISCRADLILTLTKVANHLDSINNEELRVLADTCLYQISNKDRSINDIIMRKNAVGWVIPTVKAVSTLIGLWQGSSLLQKILPKTDSGMNSSFNNLIKEIDNVKQSNTNYGVGIEFKDSFKNILEQIKKTLINYQTNYDKHSELITDIQISNASDLFNKKDQLEHSSYIINSLKDNSLIMKDFLIKVIKLLNNSSFINNQVFEKGKITSTIEGNKALDFINTLVNPFNTDVIAPLLQSCEEYLASINSLIDSLSKTQENSEKASEQAEYELGKLPEFQDPNNKNNNEFYQEENKQDFNLKDLFN